MSDGDFSKMKVADLKKELKNRGLSTLGNKNELLDRLQGALIDGGDPLEDTANSEDLLEDDELNDDILEEEEDKHDIINEEDQMLKSPTPSDASKSLSPEQPKPTESSATAQSQRLDKKDLTASTGPQKKIALKRNISITVPSTTGSTAVTETTSESESDKEKKKDEGDKNGVVNLDEPDKKVIKLTQLTAQERLEMRAKKFGAQPPEAQDSKLQARAARFGLGTSSSPATSVTTSTNLISLDALKKRAERFGVNVSNKMTKLEQDEKLQKRQERFGVTAGSTVSTTGKVAITATAKGSSGIDYAERARLRLERFKNKA